MGRFHAAALRLPISFPECASRLQLQTQGRNQRARQHHHPIFAAFGIPHDDDLAVKVHIFDAKTHTFHQPHTRAVKQPGYQRGYAVHLRQHPRHLVLGQHAGNAPLLRRAIDAIQPG